MTGRVFMQSGWVVNDLMDAVNGWLATGVGPFFILPHVQMTDIEYRGSPAKLNMSVALAQAGSTQIELIQQHGYDPSAYRDVFGSNGEGLHHLCTAVDNFETTVSHYRALGSTVVTSGRARRMPFCYIDTRDRIGCMTEVIEPNSDVFELFAHIADSSISWDGTDPIRALT
jgi:hypothetical protein